MDVLTTTPLPLAEWLAVVQREYLATFIAEGGAATKMAILEPAAIDQTGADLVALGKAHGMLTVSLDAAHTRINLMHEPFFAISRALPWDSILQYYLEGLFTAHSYVWPRPGMAMTLPELAASFGVAPTLLTRHRDQWLTADLWENRNLAQDFRAALLRLCASRLEPDGAELAAPARQWLLGEKVPATLLRSAAS